MERIDLPPAADPPDSGAVPVPQDERGREDGEAPEATRPTVPQQFAGRRGRLPEPGEPPDPTSHLGPQERPERVLRLPPRELSQLGEPPIPHVVRRAPTPVRPRIPLDVSAPGEGGATASAPTVSSPPRRQPRLGGDDGLSAGTSITEARPGVEVTPLRGAVPRVNLLPEPEPEVKAEAKPERRVRRRESARRNRRAAKELERRDARAAAGAEVSATNASVVGEATTNASVVGEAGSPDPDRRAAAEPLTDGSGYDLAEWQDAGVLRVAVPTGQVSDALAEVGVDDVPAEELVAVDDVRRGAGDLAREALEALEPLKAPLTLPAPRLGGRRPRAVEESGQPRGSHAAGPVLAPEHPGSGPVESEPPSSVVAARLAALQVRRRPDEPQDLGPSWTETVTGSTPSPPPGDPLRSVTVTAARHHAPRPPRTDLAAARDRSLAIFLACVVVLALAVGGGVAYLAHGRHDARHVTVPTVSVQHTVFTQLSGPQGLAAAAILAVGDHVDGVSVLVPRQLILDSAASGPQPLYEVFARTPTGPAQALSDALGVRLDGSWTLTTSGLSALVDALGGVRVDVDQEIVVGGIAIAPGTGQLLAGPQAAAVAIALNADEPEEKRLARFHSVLSGVLAALPPDAVAVQRLLTGLGHGSISTLSPDRLAATLTALRTQAAADGLPGTVLPVRSVEAGDALVYGLDPTRAPALIKDQLAGALLPEPEGGVVRVLVRNGVGTPGLENAARTRLAAAGLRYVPGGNADRFGLARTTVMIASSSDQDRARGVKVAAALGLPAATIAVNPLGSNLADVIVALGQDFAADVTRRGVVPSS